MLLALGILLQIGVTLGLRALGLRLFWCALAPLFLIVVYWGLGLAWIASPACANIDICDSGGMLAHTINSAALFILAAIIGLCTALGYIVRVRANAKASANANANANDEGPSEE
ncbi:MAG: hypothetical protein AAGH57_14545 [Pseudomonadota bacterium]